MEISESRKKISEIYSSYYPRLCRFATEYVGNVPVGGINLS